MTTTIQTFRRTSLSAIPSMGSQSDSKDPVAHMKFFLESFTWYASEFDGEDTFFGFVVSSHCPSGEWGYFSLNDLESVKGQFIGVEVDKHFKPTLMSKVDTLEM